MFLDAESSASGDWESRVASWGREKICPSAGTCDLSGTLPAQEQAPSFFACPSIDITESPEEPTCGCLHGQSWLSLPCQCRQNPRTSQELEVSLFYCLRCTSLQSLPPLCHQSQQLCL